MSALGRHRAALPLLILYLGGCYAWRPTLAPLTHVIEDERPSQIRVTGPDSTSMVLRDPTLEGDSAVVGMSNPGFCSEARRLSCEQLGRDVAPDTVRIPVAEVQSLEVRRLDLAGTLVATVVAVSGTLLIIDLVLVEPNWRWK